LNALGDTLGWRRSNPLSAAASSNGWEFKSTLNRCDKHKIETKEKKKLGIKKAAY